MRLVQSWLVLLLLVSALGAACSGPLPADFSLRVTDERGVPVADASVFFSWSPGSGTPANTDRAGRARVTGRSPYNQVEVRITADGHYDSRLSIPFPDHCKQGHCAVGTLDEITVRLKRRLHPVAMYHLTTDARVPDSDQPPGFDLEKGDWVHPYGIGTVTDFTYRSSCNIDPPRRFQGATYESALDAAVAALGVTRVHLVAKRRIVDDHAELLPGSDELRGFEYPAPELADGYEVYVVDEGGLRCSGQVRFPHPGDGIQFVLARNGGSPRPWQEATSDLESAQMAPESGYRPVWSYSRSDPRGDGSSQVGYLRIRTQLDDEGRILHAWYGKIYGDGSFVLSQRALRINYYVNPDGTRYVEWDPKRNLIPHARFTSHRP
jgi:hypothetical protein